MRDREVNGALVGAYSVITNLQLDIFEALIATVAMSNIKLPCSYLLPHTLKQLPRPGRGVKLLPGL